MKFTEKHHGFPSTFHGDPQLVNAKLQNDMSMFLLWIQYRPWARQKRNLKGEKGA